MMTQWVLILLVHVGAVADGNNLSVTNVPGFGTREECVAAGQASKGLTQGTVKDVRFVCVARRGS